MPQKSVNLHQAFHFVTAFMRAWSIYISWIMHQLGGFYNQVPYFYTVIHFNITSYVEL